MRFKSLNKVNWMDVLSTLELPNLTVLVGANGTGKSTVIQSLLLIRNAKETISNSVLL